MALQITNLDELNEAKVEQMFQLFTQLMQERHPDVELTRGVFHDLVVYFNSVLNATVQENIDRVLQSNSLLKIQTNPVLADPELVDQVLSNYNLVRDAGQKAIGQITVVTQLAVETVVSQNTILAAEGLRFQPLATYRGLPPGNTLVTDTDKTMIEVGDGTYAFNIDVVAQEPGAAGNIKRGTAFQPTPVPSNVDELFAAVDFVNGQDPLSNADYLARLPQALAAKTIAGRESFVAAIKARPEFSSVAHLSVLGFGDPEQQRDQHSIFPVSGGGRVDIYVQPTAFAQEVELLLPAIYMGESAEGPVWQTTLDKDVVAAFYEISRVAKPDDIFSTGFKVVADIRSVNLFEEEYVPDIVSVPESAYTKYQTAVIRFIDTETVTATLQAGQSRAVYAVTVRTAPFIAEIQNYLNQKDVRTRATDVLVKAAVPCFTTISFKIRKDANSVDPDLDAIKKALVAAIGQVGFSGQLHASVISNVAHDFLSGRQAVGEIDMFGRIRRPDGQIVFVRDNTILQIPYDPTRMVTGRTTAFLVSEKDINISVVPAGFSS